MGLIDRIRAGLRTRNVDSGAERVTASSVQSSRRDEPRADPCAEGDRLLAEGFAERALAAYQAAIDTDASVAGHVGQARAYIALERTEDAADSLEIALALDENCAGALHLLALLRRDCGHADEAAGLLQQAVVLAPDRADLRSELALVLNRMGQVDAAMATYGQAIALDPADPAPRINLGLIHLQQQGQPALAEEHFRAALEIAPRHVAGMVNLGLAMHDQGRYEDALALYLDGLRQHPGNIELRWNEGIAYLSLGDYARGWPGYEARLARPDGRKLDRFPCPPWDGQPITHGGVLVLAEQGIGDEIMFASCLHDLRARVAMVALECSPKLASLFARSFPDIAVHGMERGASCDWRRQHPELAVKVAIGSLPSFLRTSLASFPAHQRGFLVADETRVRKWRGRLDSLGTGLKVGISWRGGSPGTRGPLRSLEIGALQPLLCAPDIRFVSLQHALHPAEFEQARAAGMMTWKEATDDPEETAALVMALDLVITVANTNAHLAGALGKPAWVLLNDTPDWRWLRTGERSPWYPSLELLRPTGRPWWEATVSMLAQRLACGFPAARERSAGERSSR